MAELTFEIIVAVAVEQEPGESRESVLAYVDSLAFEWIRDEVIYSVREVPPEGEGGLPPYKREISEEWKEDNG